MLACPFISFGFYIERPNRLFSLSGWNLSADYFQLTNGLSPFEKVFAVRVHLSIILVIVYRVVTLSS